MSINNLPNECLFMIFDHFNGFDELIRLSKVSPRWFLVVLLKFSKVKYLQLMDKRQRDGDYIENDKLWKNTRETLKSHNLRDLFPNLRIMEVPKDVFLRLESYDFRRLINEHPKIKGLIGLYEPVENRYNLENIEMISSDFKFEFKKVFRPNQLKQIRLKQIYMSEFYQYVEYFPSLKRLSLTLYYDSAKPYNGPKLLDLKILEFTPSSWVNRLIGLYFMDSCPNLQSAFLYYSDNGGYTKDTVNESIKNFNLRDLVIVHSHHLTWSSLRKILAKFPNLHHFAIRGWYLIEDNHVEELVKLLPKIKLLDFRKCENITQRSADFLAKYCAKSKRSIKIYYDCEEEPIEWPKLNTPQELIVYGFDFMKHCFFKTWDSLPHLIDE
ncbi:uncharacterized protein LOC128388975 [Panonychus citri]|uniref:uncharacterized protein LOC128386282 n=1 Tax=Panonychus citri TaxID=50023 RepID=UPI0023081B60|nr:uncharacterized protein LOC128386282 [Panonychus citri]XP_053204436.1 uncharacterized protein LOC128388975 [Panonychus citri]